MNVDMNGRQYQSLDPMLKSLISSEVNGAIQTLQCSSFNNSINLVFSPTLWVSEGMFNHFMNGGGSEKQLRKSTFNKVKGYFNLIMDKTWVKEETKAFIKDGKQIYSTRKSVAAWYSLDLKLAFGGFNIFYDSDLNIVGMTDNYNFDENTDQNFILRNMNAFGSNGYNCGGRNFDYFYGITK
jgi:hypothetical protein